MAAQQIKPKAYAYLRFSTPDQLKGSSLARQSTLVRNYIEEHGLELDTQLHISDLGVSAFRGDNLKAGLGDFLTAINQSKVPAGSRLIVESLDRISRQSAFEAVPLFFKILQSGVNIVTLSDGSPKEYTKATDYIELTFAILAMHRAYEESAIKSKRLKSAWKRKRENAPNQIMTKLCPDWLELDDQTKKFKLIPDRAEILRQIFQWANDGAGDDAISRLLNRQNVPRFRQGRFWHKSYINKLINSRSVIGDFQPHRYEHDTDSNKVKRVPEGAPIEGYFPAAVDKQLFYQVRQARNAKPKSGGRKGAAFSNLFTKIVKCGYCGATMEFVNKGSPPRGQKYLACSRARRGAGCKCRAWRYELFEEAILKYCGQIDLAKVLYSGTPRDKKQNLLDERAAIEGEIGELRERVSTLIDALGTLNKSARTSVTDAINKISETISLKEQRHAQLTVAVDALTDPELLAAQVSDALTEFRERDKTEDQQKRLLLRIHLNQEIQRAILAFGLYRDGLQVQFGPPDIFSAVTIVIFQSGAWQVIGEKGTLLSQIFVGQEGSTRVQTDGLLLQESPATTKEEQETYTNCLLLIVLEAEKLKKLLGIPIVSEMANTKVQLLKLSEESASESR